MPAPCRHRVGDRWWVDETYVKVAGQWCYVYWASDQFGQVIGVGHYELGVDEPVTLRVVAAFDELVLAI